MAPAAEIDVPITASKKIDTASRLDGPLTYSGSLDSYEHFDVTNVIGREFPTLQLSDIVNDDTKVRDLAILGTSSGLM